MYSLSSICCLRLVNSLGPTKRHLKWKLHWVAKIHERLKAAKKELKRHFFRSQEAWHAMMWKSNIEWNLPGCSCHCIYSRECQPHISVRTQKRFQVLHRKSLGAKRQEAHQTRPPRHLLLISFGDLEQRGSKFSPLNYMPLQWIYTLSC